MMHCLEYRDLLRGHQWSSFLWTRYAYYPPLVYQVTAVLHVLLGPGPWVAWAVMQAFALALGAATWRVARTAGGPLMACLAAVLAMLLPIVVVFTREVALDVALMAASTTMLALALEDPLRTRRSAAVLGVVMGLGLLIKWTFALMAVGPLVYLAVAAARGRASGRHFALALAVAAALAAPWYVHNLGPLWADV